MILSRLALIPLPFAISSALITLWAISWALAAVWTRRTTARPSRRDQLIHLAPTVAGALLMGIAMRLQLGVGIANLPPIPLDQRLWALPTWGDWLLAGGVAAGIAFMWWARLTLGDLWSGHVTRKEGHALVQRGPYRLVRHPIYTGLIFAFLCFAAQVPSVAAFAGVALMTFGFWLKARLEERFLIAGLGEAAYADYRRRTPMLVPFWPALREPAPPGR